MPLGRWEVVDHLLGVLAAPSPAHVGGPRERCPLGCLGPPPNLSPLCGLLGRTAPQGQSFHCLSSALLPTGLPSSLGGDQTGSGAGGVGLKDRWETSWAGGSVHDGGFLSEASV